jgi:thiol-disulfide isomerase/thioredoxin
MMMTLAVPALGQGEVKPEVAAAAPAVKPLTIGDRAPKLEVDTWVKGEAVKDFEKGHTYVVEFWATWCAPCRVSIPHLTAVQKKVGDKATIIGVSIWEQKGALDEVKSFVERMGDEMNYRVAYGGDDAPMAKTWMEAAEQDGIPTAFIVNGEGRIAWIGHPMGGEMDRVLDQVIAGAFDIDKAAAAARRRAEVLLKARPIQERWRQAARARNWEDANKAADELIALDAEEFGGLAPWKFRTLAGVLNQPEQAYAYIRPLVDGPLKNNAMILNSVAWSILDDAGIENRDFDLALRLAQRAADLTNREDGMILDTLALALFRKGRVTEAITTQERALELTRDPDTKAEFAARLEMFKKAR